MVDTEPNLYLPSDPHSRPFDLSFDPCPAPPQLTSHGCTSHTVGANIIISRLPPRLPLDPNSLDVLQFITANADSHLQKYERKKLGHTNKTDPSTSHHNLRRHTNRRTTPSKHATDPFCDRPSWQNWPTSPKLPLRSPPSTTTSIPTFQTKCHPNVPKITTIAKSQRYPSLGESQLVSPSYSTFLWTFLSCTHSFHHHRTVSWSILRDVISTKHSRWV